MYAYPARGGEPMDLAVEMGAGSDQATGDHAVANDVHAIVDIVEEALQSPYPLGHPGGDAVPFGVGDDARDISSNALERCIAAA